VSDLSYRRRYRSTSVAIALTAIASGTALAGTQLNVLPDPPVGVVTVRLTPIVTGLGEPLPALNSTGADGFSFPTDAWALDDGRLLIMTLKGTIFLRRADGMLVEFHDFIDPAISKIQPRNFGPVTIAAHPDFLTNGIFHTVETERENTAPADFGFAGTHQDVLYEYVMADPAADRLADTTFTKRELMRIDQPRPDHNLNDIDFFADGTMALAIGDGGNLSSPGNGFTQVRAQNLGLIQGKVIRIDPLGANSANVQYGIPADNPFVGTPGALPEIYSYGHRNPFRLTIDALAQDVWVGEVGQRTVEELNRVLPGANHGWPTKEGSFLFGIAAGDANGDTDIDNQDVAIDPDADMNGTGDTADANGFTDPVFEYDHGTGDSVSGGYVYRGSAIPELAGMYLFADFDPSEPEGLFWGDPASGPVSGATGDVFRFQLAPDSAPIPVGTVAVVPDADGEPLLLSTGGEILRMEPVAPENTCAFDFNNDGIVDGADFGVFGAAFGSMAGDASYLKAADSDGNGSVDGADFGAFGADFGRTDCLDG
jgi:glucose/arabinose dehydrogenase